MDNTRSDLIAKIYESKEIASALRKMQPAELREELKQEMFVCLCQLSDEKFWSIYNNNGLPGLKYWLVRTMLNMIYSTSINQPFYRNFRFKFDSLDNLENLAEAEGNDKETKEYLYLKLEDNRKELSWYENKLLDTWCDLGMSSAKVSRETHIPYMSIIRTITQIKSKLRDERETK